MSVREYIGARYVPLFMGEWDNTVTYEPLSIVQYQGNSFTSRQFVPVGIAIDNDAFWAETGNYNAQVEQYREEVQTFDGRITALENEEPATPSHMLTYNTVNNAVLQFASENTTRSGLQGITPFSLSNVYDYDNPTMFFGAMVGADTAKVFVVFDKDGNEVGSVDMPNGHFGMISYDGHGKIYANNYLYDGNGNNRLYIIDVSTPTNPTVSDVVQIPLAEGVTAWNGAVVHYKDDSFFVYKVTSSQFEMYIWDKTDNSVTYHCTLERRNANLTAYSMSHINYDVDRNLFYRNGNRPNTIDVYHGTTGEFLNTISVPDFAGFASTGELEQFTVYGNHAFIGCVVHANAAQTTNNIEYEPELIEVFYFDISGMAKPQHTYLQRTRVLVDYSNVTGGRNYFDGSDIHVKYFTQAVKCVENILNCTVIVFNSLFPYVAHAYFAKARLQIECANQTDEFIKAMHIDSGIAARLAFRAANIDDSNAGVVYSSKVFKIWATTNSIEIPYDLGSPANTDGLLLTINSVVNSASLHYATIRNSIVKTNVADTCQIQNNSYVFAITDTSSVVDSTSAIVTKS